MVAQLPHPQQPSSSPLALITGDSEFFVAGSAAALSSGTTVEKSSQTQRGSPAMLSAPVSG